MQCNGCGNKTAYKIKRTSFIENCNRCGNLASTWVPDVYFKGPYLDPNLAHPHRPNEINGVWIRSRRHKALLLAEQNLIEKGDKYHGTRNEDRFLQKRIRDQ